jgi:hypothetical protein
MGDERQLLNYEADFRSEAAHASNQLMGGVIDRNALGDLTQVGVSLCIPATSSPKQSHQLIRRRILTELVVKFTVLTVGAILFAIAHSPAACNLLGITAFPAWPGIALLSIGWLTVMSSVDIEHLLVRFRLRQMGVTAPNFSPTERVRIGRVEDPSTHKVIKLCIDDAGFLYCDAQRSLILLEGVCYRYVIRAEDVLSCKPLGNRFAEIRFRVAGSEQILSLAICLNSMRLEYRRQLTGGLARPAIMPLLERTFGLPIPWEVAASDHQPT